MKTQITRTLAAGCAAAMFGTSAYAEELRIDRLFVVGDSLSDGGTYTQPVIAGGMGALPDNIRYRFTNNMPDGSSRTYAEGLAARLGIPLDPNVLNGVGPIPPVNLGGTNYAQGGARVSQPALDAPVQTPRGITQLPVSEQVTSLLASNPSFTDSDLVILWAGSNDVLTQGALSGAGAITPADAGANIVQAADDFVSQVDRVKAAGASKVVIVTVPDIGANTPRGVGSGPAGSAGLSGLVNTFNDRVATGLAGKDVAVVNSDRLLQHVLDNPARYGFADIDQRRTTECLPAPGAMQPNSLTCVQGGPLTRNDGQQRVFADGVHPTTQAHAIFADAAHSGLVASTQAGAIPVATLTAIRQSAIGLENRLNLGAIYTTDETGNRIPRPIGDVEVYGGGEVGFFSGDAQQVLPGLDAQTQIVKIAADVAVAPKVVLGVGGSMDHGQVEFDGNRGGFDSRLFIGAIFGVAELFKGVYVNGALGYGHINVYDIDRNFTVGVSQESYSADANGKYYTGKVNLGAMLPLGNGVLINPSIGFTHEVVEIDGYTETPNNGGVLARSFGETEIEANRGTLALSGFYRPPSDESWIFGMRASYEHDFNDEDLSVSSAETGGALASFTAPRPDGDFGYLSGTVTKELTEHSSLTFGASTVVGLDGVSGYTANLLYKQNF